VIAEIALRKREYGIKFVYFMDNTFGVNLDLLRELMRRFAREIGLPFWCFLHPRVVTAERVEALKQGGCRAIALGIESGIPTHREEFLHRRYSNERLLEAIRIIRGHGIRVQTSSILGLPGSDLETDLETLHLNVLGHVDQPDAYLYRPYPGTALTRRAKSMALIAEDDSGADVAITPTLVDSVRVRVAHETVVRKLALLFPLAVKSRWIRDRLKTLIRLPLAPLYLIVYKFTIMALKYRNTTHRHASLGANWLRVVYYQATR
jgi:radical SAM superfamily enzyme YgiQ (UPF0313 family)